MNEPLDLAREMLTPLEERQIRKIGDPVMQPRCVACRFIVLDGEHAAECAVGAYLVRLAQPAPDLEAVRLGEAEEILHRLIGSPMEREETIRQARSFLSKSEARESGGEARDG